MGLEDGRWRMDALPTQGVFFGGIVTPDATVTDQYCFPLKATRNQSIVFHSESYCNR